MRDQYFTLALSLPTFFPLPLLLNPFPSLPSSRTHMQVLLVSSRNFAGEWTIPGGGVEPMEMGQQTAAREALEEVGVRGEGEGGGMGGWEERGGESEAMRHWKRWV